MTDNAEVKKRMKKMLGDFGKHGKYAWESLLCIDGEEKILFQCRNGEITQGEGYLCEKYGEELLETFRKLKVKEDYGYFRQDGIYYVLSLLDVDIDDEAEGIFIYGIKALERMEDMICEIGRINSMNYELREALEKSFDAIYITDASGTTIIVNEAHERISGINRNKLLNHRIDKMVEKGVFSGFITKKVIEEKKPITILQQVAATQKNLLITGSPVYNKNKEIVKVVTNVRDMTELISLQKELKTSKAIIEKYKSELFESGDDQDAVVHEGSKFQQIMKLAKKVAVKESTVLILGETGVGKEIVARYIFSNSVRRQKNYLKINCGAIPSNLLESELFGYVKGAFTGADPGGKMGLFEIANNGTLFLDEIGELPLHLQASLLRVLQDGEITRIGDTKSRKVNVRIIAATNRDLESMIKAGTFRQDLYYRLNVVSINIPPLRDRIDEIPELVERTIRKLNKKYGEHKVVTEAFVEHLMDKPWPGNIRELENYVEKFFVIVDDEIIDVPKADQGRRVLMRKPETEPEDEPLLPMKDAIERVEKRQILAALAQGGSTYKAAELLGMSQSTFFRRYKKLVLEDGQD